MDIRKRKQYTSEQKVSIIKDHLVGKKPVSELCEYYGIAVNMFYRWQEEFFQRSAGVFD
jgi:transposase